MNKNKILMIKRCDLMLQDLKHFKIYHHVLIQNISKCHKVSQSVAKFTKHSFRDGVGGWVVVVVKTNFSV